MDDLICDVINYFPCNCDVGKMSMYNIA